MIKNFHYTCVYCDEAVESDATAAALPLLDSFSMAPCEEISGGSGTGRKGAAVVWGYNSCLKHQQVLTLYILIASTSLQNFTCALELTFTVCPIMVCPVCLLSPSPLPKSPEAWETEREQCYTTVFRHWGQFMTKIFTQILTASKSSSSEHKSSAARGFPTTFSSAISP